MAKGCYGESRHEDSNPENGYPSGGACFRLKTKTKTESQRQKLHLPPHFCQDSSYSFFRERPRAGHLLSRSGHARPRPLQAVCLSAQHPAWHLLSTNACLIHGNVALGTCFLLSGSSHSYPKMGTVIKGNSEAQGTLGLRWTER